MEDLPVEILDKVFDYLSLKEIATHRYVSEHFTEVADRQFKRRCGTHSWLSSYQQLRSFTINHVFKIFGPYLRHLDVDILYTEFVSHVLDRCPNLDSLTFVYRLENSCKNDLSAIKNLKFASLICYEQVLQTYLRQCSSNLESLTFEDMGIIGKVFHLIPASIRKLHLIDSHIGLNCLSSYPDCLTHSHRFLGSLRKARKVGSILTVENYENLAKLNNLCSLRLDISTPNFRQFADALDDSQKLTELYLSIGNCIITEEITGMFQKFKELTKLTLHVGVHVIDSDSLLRPIGLLAKHGKLRTLVLSGCVEGLDLDDIGYELAYVKDVQVLKDTCTCNEVYGN